MPKKRFGRFMVITLAAFLTMVLANTAHAAHPLITDDTGTQGKGKFQLEVNGEYGRDKDDGVVTKTTQLGTILSYGLSDPVDIVLAVPYLHIRTEAGQALTDSGISDIALEAKWRFYEKEGLSLALKPGVTLDTGDDEEGLGSGKTTYHLFLIGTHEIRPWAFHINLGYIRNENRQNDRRDIWHVSLATTVEAVKDLKIVGNFGLERDAARDRQETASFLLGGVIYSVSENFDIDAGIKSELHRFGADFAILSGITWRF